MKKFFIIIPFCFFCFFCFFCCTKKPQKRHSRLHTTSKKVDFDHWIHLDPQEEHFSALFPQEPKIYKRNLLIPGKEALCLPYKEFSCEMENGTLYSISYTILPNDWLKYGSSLVLKEALKVLVKELGKIEVVGKKITSFKSFPALDYEHYKISEIEQKETTGTLALIGNVLYKIEMTYPPTLRDAVQGEVVHFIENFSPEERALKENPSE